MQTKPFPVIDPVATGRNIVRLRQERGMSVRDLQSFFGFEEPQAIYKWQQGKSLPSVDNLYALGALLEVPLDAILAPAAPNLNIVNFEQQDDSCCSIAFSGCPGGGGPWKGFSHFAPPAAGFAFHGKLSRRLDMGLKFFLRHHSQQTMNMEMCLHRFVGGICMSANGRLRAGEWGIMPAERFNYSLLTCFFP